MIKQGVIAVGLIASVCYYLPVHAGFLDMGKAATGMDLGASSGNVEKDIDSFLGAGQKAQDLTAKAVSVLFAAIASKEEVRKSNDALAAATKLADPKEREAALRKVEDDQSAALAKANYVAKAKELERSANEKQKKLIGAAFYNYSLGILKDTELASKGTNIVSSASSNPMLIPKVMRVKDVMNSLAGQMENSKKIGTGMQQLASVVKLPAAPSSSSSEPVSYEGG